MVGKDIPATENYGVLVGADGAAAHGNACGEGAAPCP
jgi:hypothetical protein